MPFYSVYSASLVNDKHCRSITSLPNLLIDIGQRYNLWSFMVPHSVLYHLLQKYLDFSGYLVFGPAVIERPHLLQSSVLCQIFLLHVPFRLDFNWRNFLNKCSYHSYSFNKMLKWCFSTVWKCTSLSTLWFFFPDYTLSLRHVRQLLIHYILSLCFDCQFLANIFFVCSHILIN